MNAHSIRKSNEGTIHCALYNVLYATANRQSPSKQIHQERGRGGVNISTALERVAFQKAAQNSTEGNAEHTCLDLFHE